MMEFIIILGSCIYVVAGFSIAMITNIENGEDLHDSIIRGILWPIELGLKTPDAIKNWYASMKDLDEE